MSTSSSESAAQGHPALQRYDDDQAGLNGEQGQFLVFRLAGESLALPLASVGEIIRPPAITKVPLSPQAMLGLVSLRGRVMPVACLRQLAGVAEDEADSLDDELSRLLILKQGGGLALRVDQVQRVLTATLPESKEDDDGQDNGLITRGTISDNEALIHLLDVERMLSRELGDWQSLGGESASAAANSSEEIRAQGKSHQEEKSREVILRVRLGEQLFGLPATRISGILEYPETISPLPKTPRALIGVASLRGENRPVFSLAALLGLEGKAAGGHVVLLRGTRAGEQLALAVDGVEGVMRVAEDELDPVPESIARNSDELANLYRDSETRELVTLINLPRFLEKHELIGLAASVVGGSDDNSNAGEGARSQFSRKKESGTMQQFVVFQLDEQRFAARIESVREILRLPESLTGVPAASGEIEGVINLRGRVLPVIDMRRRFDLPQVERNESQRVLVLEIQGQRTGFIVDAVSEVMKVAPDSISPASQMAGSRADWISSVIRGGADEDMVLVLDEEALLSDEALNTLRAVS